MAARASAVAVVRSDFIFGFVIGRSRSTIPTTSLARSATLSGTLVACFSAASMMPSASARILRLLVGLHHRVVRLGIGIDRRLQLLAQLRQTRDRLAQLTLVLHISLLAARHGGHHGGKSSRHGAAGRCRAASAGSRRRRGQLLDKRLDPGAQIRQPPSCRPSPPPAGSPELAENRNSPPAETTPPPTPAPSSESVRQSRCSPA